MMRTQLNLWACGLALGLAVGGSVAPPTAQAQFAPVELGDKQGVRDKNEPPQKVVVTSPQVKDVVVTQHYPCQIRARRHIAVRALSAGSLEAIPVREGQVVKKGDVLFKIAPILYKARLDAELAQVKLARIELDNTRKLFDQNVVAQQEVALYEAKLARAQAKAKLAEAELSFATVSAPFDGLVGRLEQQEGSLVKEGDPLSTLTDNSVMWVYFDIPEARYLDYMNSSTQEKDDQRIELLLANDSKYKYPGDFRPFSKSNPSGAIEARFNNESGNIAFRADFQNPERLLRHGMTGTILIHRTLKNATVIPQRAAFEDLDRRYVYVVGKDYVVHRREIVVQNEVDEIFVITKGLEVTDKIVLEGGQHLRDGDKVEYVFRKNEPQRHRDREKAKKRQ